MEHPEILVELGAILVGLAVLSRIATRTGMPTIPLYLAAGLAFGKGGVLPLVTAEEFVEVGAEIGLILLLFMLGLEYTAADLLSTIRAQARIGVLDFALNFTPGFLAAFVLGWDAALATVLGGVTYVSSSGIVAKVLADQGWTGNRETPVVLSTLVVEDLVMVLYLPVVGALLIGSGGMASLAPAALAVVLVAAVLGAATRIEVGMSRALFSHSDEALLLTILGVTILVAGGAEAFGISAAVAALLVGIVLSGPAAEAAYPLLTPMRDLFAAMFFAFVGLAVDPASIPPVLLPATILGFVTLLTKAATGWIGAARAGVGVRGAVRAGLLLTARGEFSIAIAGFATAAGVAADFEALAVAYVFVMAIVGPLLVRFAEPIAALLVRRTVDAPAMAERRR